MRNKRYNIGLRSVLQHFLQITITILCMSLAVTGCDDPAGPGPVGGIILTIRTFAATQDPELTVIDHFTVQTERVEVVHVDPDGNESQIVVDSAPRTLTLNNRDETRFVAQYPIAVGSASQIRIFPKEVTMVLKDGASIELGKNSQKPSFDQSGWKIIAGEGGWPLIDNELTGVRALFHINDKVLYNNGVGYKIKPTMPAEIFSVNPPKGKPGLFADRIVVAFKAGVSRRQVDAINAEIGATVIEEAHFSSTYAMKLPPTKNLQDASAFYRAKPEVVARLPDMRIAPTDLIPNEGVQDAQALANLPAAWGHLASNMMPIGNNKIVIAVIDTGVDVAHPDLALNMAINQGEIPAEIKAQIVDADGDPQITTFVDLNDSKNAAVRPFDINGNGFVDGVDLIKDPNWANQKDDDQNCALLLQGCVDDLVGWNTAKGRWDNDVTPDLNNLAVTDHGTAMAGIIGAQGNNSLAVAGALWQVQIIPIRADVDGENGTMSPIAVIDAMAYASIRGADIANLSLGIITVSDAADLSCFQDSTLKEMQSVNQATIPQAEFDEGVESGTFIFSAREHLFCSNCLFQSETLYVFGAGNDRANVADPNIFLWPGEGARLAFPDQALVVGATESKEATMASYSNYGAPVVEVFAPANNVKVLKPWDSGANCAPGNDAGCTTIYERGGTSSASALVTGIAGMALQAFPQLKGDPVALHNHIVQTANPVVSEFVVCSPQQNQPLVDANAAVTTSP